MIRAMTDSTLPADPLASLASRDPQIQAARLAQEAFATAFRLSVENGAERREAALATLAGHLEQWILMSSADARPLRRALVLTGLDQWGLAYSQIFGAEALGGVSDLIGRLRNTIPVEIEAACQGQLEAIRGDEASAYDFKFELRRELHLALWHSMIASEDRDEAFTIMKALGGMMRSLVREMPTLGWRLLADALALIQIRCLAHGLAGSGLARETTTELFASLAAELPEEIRNAAMSLASESVLAWQQAQRSAQH